MAQVKTMDFKGKIEITEVEIIGTCEVDSAIETIEESMTDTTATIEMLQISYIMCAQYAVSQDITNSTATWQCIHFTIWQCFWTKCATKEQTITHYNASTTNGNSAKQSSL